MKIFLPSFGKFDENHGAQNLKYLKQKEFLNIMDAYYFNSTVKINFNF